MIKEPKFYISKGLYAVDLSGMLVRTQEVDVPHGRTRRSHRVDVPAVWFRRRRGVTVACIGGLWAYMSDPAPADVHEALARMDDGRYGGGCEARWDGTGYWGSEIPAERDRHLELLVPMLENYPAVPAGYDGWWRYETDRERAIARNAAAACS